VPSNEI